MIPLEFRDRDDPVVIHPQSTKQPGRLVCSGGLFYVAIFWMVVCCLLLAGAATGYCADKLTGLHITFAQPSGQPVDATPQATRDLPPGEIEFQPIGSLSIELKPSDGELPENYGQQRQKQAGSRRLRPCLSRRDHLEAEHQPDQGKNRQRGLRAKQRVVDLLQREHGQQDGEKPA